MRESLPHAPTDMEVHVDRGNVLVVLQGVCQCLAGSVHDHIELNACPVVGCASSGVVGVERQRLARLHWRRVQRLVVPVVA